MMRVMGVRGLTLYHLKSHLQVSFVRGRLFQPVELLHSCVKHIVVAGIWVAAPVQYILKKKKQFVFGAYQVENLIRIQFFYRK